MIEPWLYGLISGMGGGLLGAVGFGWWSGRNVVTKADLDILAKALYEQISAIRKDLTDELKIIEQTTKDDRHTARTNMDQRTEQFQEKVDSMRDRYETILGEVHVVALTVARIESSINGTTHKR